MERATFLIESTGERLSCMLNPETLEMQRSTGLRTLPSTRGMHQEGGQDEDPVYYAGGGRTELRLDLLFDTTLAGSTVEAEDVRVLTTPLWRLSGQGGEAGATSLPLVRFIWGRSWNVPGVITAVAERFEHFNAEGDPRRSWISLRFRRVNEPQPPPEPPGLTGEQAALLASDLEAGPMDEGENFLESLPGDEDPLLRSEPLSVVAERMYGDPSWWRFLAVLNDLENPVFAPPYAPVRAPEVPGRSSQRPTTLFTP